MTAYEHDIFQVGPQISPVGVEEEGCLYLCHSIPYITLILLLFTGTTVPFDWI